MAIYLTIAAALGLFTAAQADAVWNITGHAIQDALVASAAVTIFLSGDVMTGRGIDQILPHPVEPVLHESYMKSARGYVDLAESKSGPIDRPVGFAYIWGDALAAFDRTAPDVRIINLETSVTESDAYWRGKGINYRMHPKNIPVLQAAGIDVATLANNHVADWGYAGLIDTLDALKRAGINTAGAGRNRIEAGAPAVAEIEGKGRVVVFAFGSTTSGIPRAWAAGEAKPGVDLLGGLDNENIRAIGRRVAAVKRESDIVVASIHWGGNWGYGVPRDQTVFAHRLIDDAGVDIVHGHSSHHVRAIEVYRGKLVLYGCGDFINDYEGIGGHEEFRGDLSLMYFAQVDATNGRLIGLTMAPTRMVRFRVTRAATVDTLWLQETLNREGAAFGTRVEVSGDGRLKLVWNRR